MCCQENVATAVEFWLIISNGDNCEPMQGVFFRVAITYAMGHIRTSYLVTNKHAAVKPSVTSGWSGVQICENQ